MTPNRCATPTRGAGTSVLERPETKESPVRDDGGDADRFAHYVSKDRIAESRATGRPVVALCGKVWVPRHQVRPNTPSVLTASASTRK